MSSARTSKSGSVIRVRPVPASRVAAMLGADWPSSPPPPAAPRHPPHSRRRRASRASRTSTPSARSRRSVSSRCTSPRSRASRRSSRVGALTARLDVGRGDLLLPVGLPALPPLRRDGPVGPARRRAARLRAPPRPAHPAGLLVRAGRPRAVARTELPRRLVALRAAAAGLRRPARCSAASRPRGRCAWRSASTRCCRSTPWRCGGRAARSRSSSRSSRPCRSPCSRSAPALHHDGGAHTIEGTLPGLFDWFAAGHGARGAQRRRAPARRVPRGRGGPPPSGCSRW